MKYVTLLLCLFAGSALAEPPQAATATPRTVASEMAHAPIVSGPAIQGVLLQTEWLSYPADPDVTILYCVREGDATLECVAYVVVPGKAAGIIMRSMDAPTVKN